MSLICFILQRDIIWVSCEGDAENLGPVNYSPRRGFPSHYFPFKNIKGYHPPIVAVQFERPKRKSTILTNKY